MPIQSIGGSEEKKVVRTRHFAETAAVASPRRSFSPFPLPLSLLRCAVPCSSSNGLIAARENRLSRLKNATRLLGQSIRDRGRSYIGKWRRSKPGVVLKGAFLLTSERVAAIRTPWISRPCSRCR